MRNWKVSTVAVVALSLVVLTAGLVVGQGEEEGTSAAMLLKLSNSLDKLNAEIIDDAEVSTATIEEVEELTKSYLSFSAESGEALIGLQAEVMNKTINTLTTLYQERPDLLPKATKILGKLSGELKQDLKVSVEVGQSLNKLTLQLYARQLDLVLGLLE